VIAKGAFALLLAIALNTSAAQQAASTGRKSAHADARAKWPAGARSSIAANAADLRERAILQKLRLHTARFSNLAGLAGAWTSLGPIPHPSDASGTGLQDYNWVSGRATSVAVDPNDASGNTLYIGAAGGGVWKSSNAGAISQDSGAVVWTPLTDDRPTLAIGAVIEAFTTRRMPVRRGMRQA
jgi:hypothetical protein